MQFMHWNELFNACAALFIVATASSKTMVPLRILSIVANCFLIFSYAVTHTYVLLALQAITLPVNGYRLYQMVALIRNVRELVRGNTSMDWLKPFMTGRNFKKGDILFAKGESANEMFCTVTGRYRLLELGIELQTRAGRRRAGDAGARQPAHRDTRMHRGRRSVVDHL